MRRGWRRPSPGGCRGVGGDVGDVAVREVGRQADLMPGPAVVGEDATPEAAARVAAAAPGGPDHVVLAGDSRDRVTRSAVGQLLPVRTRRALPGLCVGPYVLAAGHPVPGVGAV